MGLREHYLEKAQALVRRMPSKADEALDPAHLALLQALGDEDRRAKDCRQRAIDLRIEANKLTEQGYGHATAASAILDALCALKPHFPGEAKDAA